MDPSTLRGDDPEDRNPFHGEVPTAQGPPMFGAVQRFFTGGNALVRIGIVILFFGIAFLVRYAAQHSHVPIEIRLTGVALGGMALLSLGWRLRRLREGFALSLQGGGIGILYLTVFAALRLYALVPTAGALALLICIAGLSAMLAVLQNSQSLALLGIIGGFLAPILAGSGKADHVVLFGYYLVLNGGILLVSWHKAWRGLNLVGFIFTFGLGTLWGVLTYRPEDFATTEPFLIAIFLMYVGMAVLFTWRQPLALRGYIDGPLLFGTPLAAFGLQASMLHDHHLALGFSALGVSGLYLSLAALLKRRHSDSQRMLIDSFIALGVVFLTLAMPLALGSRWNAGAWALEGSALIWIGCRQDRALARLFGALLLFATSYLLCEDFRIVDFHLELSLQALPAVLSLSAASMVSAKALLAHARRRQEQDCAASEILAGWATLWWVLGGMGVIATQAPAATVSSVSLGFLSVTTLGLSLLFRTLPLRTLQSCSLSIVVILGLYALNALLTVAHPAEHGGAIAWPVAFACFYLVLYQRERTLEGSDVGVGTLHTVIAWLLVALTSWEASWQTDSLIHGAGTWPIAVAALLPALALLGIPRWVARVSWPFAAHRNAYLYATGTGFAVFLGLWSLTANFSMPGDTAPLSYLPLLNPLDVIQVLCLMALARHWKAMQPLGLLGESALDQSLPRFTFGALSFIWLNAVLLRTLHQWADVPFSVGGILASTLAETYLSIFWAVLAIAAMLLATYKRDRPVWYAGVSLLGVVIGKLFFVDLATVGSIERIVSFIGVGLLMLVVGYYSPLPPKLSRG